MVNVPRSLAIGLTLLIAGCTTPHQTTSLPTTTPPTLTGHWTLTKASSLKSLPDGAIDLHLRSAAAGDSSMLDASGHAGVNPYVAQVSALSGQRLRFGPIATTRRAGPPERMTLEQAYLKELEGVATYTFVAGQLELRTLHGETLHFSPR